MCIHIIINFLLRMSVLFYLQIIEEGPIIVAPPETVKQFWITQTYFVNPSLSFSYLKERGWGTDSFIELKV